MWRTALGFCLVSLGAAPSPASWEMNEFVIYLWGLPEVDDADAKARALADAGFTVVDADPSELDVLARYGLKAMLHDPTPAMAARLAEYPALWGYHCADEPYSDEAFYPLAELFGRLRQADPHHPTFVNMLSTTGEFLRTSMDVVKPEILSFDSTNGGGEAIGTSKSSKSSGTRRGSRTCLSGAASRSAPTLPSSGGMTPASATTP